MAEYFIGWDVGAWHCDTKNKSRDAIFIYDIDNKQIALFIGNASYATCETDSPRAFLEKLFPNFIPENESITCRIAIDAILGWPEEFHELIMNKNEQKNTYIPDLDGGKKSNKYLMRTTERLLANKKFNDFYITPLSAVQDMLGSQSTKILCFLQKMRFTTNGEGEWKYEDKLTQCTALETYPTILRSIETLHGNYLNEQPVYDSKCENKGIFKQKSIDSSEYSFVSPKKEILEYLANDSDVKDAMYCLRLALTESGNLFHPTKKGLSELLKDVDVNNDEQKDLSKLLKDAIEHHDEWKAKTLKKEGWIWIPKNPKKVLDSLKSK